MRLFKQGETEVTLHWSLLIPFGLVATRPGNLVLMLLIFALVLAHEFGHIVMARRYGIKCPKVILCALGGMAVMENEPRRPGAEFAIAFAGPAVNIVFIGISLMSVRLLPPVVLIPFILVNGLIAGFNLIPAYPMDGGRLLRAILWKFLPFENKRERATIICKGLAVVLGVIGLYFASQHLLWMLGMISVSVIVMAFVPEDEDEQESVSDQVDEGTGSGRPAP